MIRRTRLAASHRANEKRTATAYEMEAKDPKITAVLFPPRCTQRAQGFHTLAEALDAACKPHSTIILTPNAPEGRQLFWELYGYRCLDDTTL